MRTPTANLLRTLRGAAAALLLLPAAALAQQNPMTVKNLADGLPGAYGVARHPDGSVYVSQLDAGQIVAIRDGRPRAV